LWLWLQVLKPISAGGVKVVPGSVATKCLAVLSAPSDAVVFKVKVVNNSKAGPLKDVVVVAGVKCWVCIVFLVHSVLDALKTHG
jgi:hypothetical protein